jgi:hypothetical protein
MLLQELGWSFDHTWDISSSKLVVLCGYVDRCLIEAELCAVMEGAALALVVPVEIGADYSLI